MLASHTDSGSVTMNPKQIVELLYVFSHHLEYKTPFSKSCHGEEWCLPQNEHSINNFYDLNLKKLDGNQTRYWSF
jgi:hypothetical protein